MSVAQGSAPGVRREWSPAPLESTDKATRTGGDGLERWLHSLPGEQDHLEAVPMAGGGGSQERGTRSQVGSQGGWEVHTTPHP